MPRATLNIHRLLLLAGLLSACSDREDPQADQSAAPGDGLSEFQSSDRPTDAETGLDPAAEGWDTEVLGDDTKHHIKDLLHLGTHPSAAAVAPFATDAVTVTALRPQPFQTIREGSDFLVRRAEPTPGSHAGADALASALTDLFAPFSSEPDVRVKVWRVEPERSGARITLFYQAVGQSEGRPLQQNATWQCRLNPAGDRIAELTTLHHEEVLGPIGSQSLFTECTLGVLGADEDLARQLIPSLSDLASATDVTVGPQIAEYEGLAIGDANGDGLEDVYLCQTRGLPNRLLLQCPDGTIQEASHGAGIDILDRTHAALFIDLDADGDQDLIVGGLSLLFFENHGNELDPATGTAIPSYTLRQSIEASDSYSISAVDVDLDRDLDLFICRYRATQENFPTPYHDARNGLANILLRNEGGWTFTDATEELGLNHNNDRFSFAATWTDIDSDGDPDLYVANDFGRNNLYRNDEGHFSDVAAELGVEDISAGMSADWGDPDSDGDYDIYVGNMFSAAGNRIAYQRKFQTDADAGARDAFKRHARGNSLFLNQGAEGFLDVSVQAGVTMGRWSWCSRFVDIDNDCREDIIVSNGYITSPGSTHDL